MIDFLAKYALKAVVFALISTLILRTIIDITFPFLQFLASGSLLTVFKTIDYFLPLPFLISSLFAYLALRYFHIFWAFYNWIYRILFY